MPNSKLKTSTLLLAGLAALGAEAVVTAVSETAAVDTRGQTVATTTDPGSLDTRSRSTGWSVSGPLDTRKPVGSLMLLR